jgi:hypothetical protein
MEIQIEYLHNTSLKSYRYTDLNGNVNERLCNFSMLPLLRRRLCLNICKQMSYIGLPNEMSLKADNNILKLYHH